MDIRRLKERGKAAMKENYWMSVAAGLIFGVGIAGTGSGAGGSINKNIKLDDLTQDPNIFAIIVAIFATVIVVLIVAVLLEIFVINPLKVGCSNFFRINYETGKGRFEDIGRSYKPAWLNNVKTLFLSDLFVFLWSLLFVIPGIVKSYSYRMVPYIIADHPEITGTEAITLSRKMMNGHKMDAFIFDLSFLGWYILGCLTCGLLYIFYVNPYYYNSAAGIYDTLKTSYPELNN